MTNDEVVTCEPLLPSVYAPAMVVAQNWYERLKEMERECARLRRDLGRLRKEEYLGGLREYGQGNVRGLLRVRDSSVPLRWRRAGATI